MREQSPPFEREPGLLQIGEKFLGFWTLEERIPYLREQVSPSKRGPVLLNMGREIAFFWWGEGSGALIGTKEDDSFFGRRESTNRERTKVNRVLRKLPIYVGGRGGGGGQLECGSKKGRFCFPLLFS